MTIIEIVVILVFIGVGLYVLNRVVPMDGNVKIIINAVVILVVLLWVLECFGLIGPYSLGHLRGPLR